jgi:hypothetical protein
MKIKKAQIKRVLSEAAAPVVDTAQNYSPRFKKKLDLSLDAIRDGTDEYKRDCVTLVENRRSLALKYSAAFAVISLFYLMVYGFLNSSAALAERPNPLGRLDVIQIIMPVIIIPSLVAIFMRPRAIVLTIVLYMLIAAYFTVIWHFVVVVPFAVIGCAIYIRLSNVADAHFTLTEQPGYPDFMPLTKDIIAGKAEPAGNAELAELAGKAEPVEPVEPAGSAANAETAETAGSAEPEAQQNPPTEED